jgi:hypothetical protein
VRTIGLVGHGLRLSRPSQYATPRAAKDEGNSPCSRA